MGCILSPAAEAEHIATYFRGVYHSTHLHSPPDASAVLGMKFTAEELSFAFSKLQPRKALPNKFAPARLWKEASQLLVPYILPAVNLQHNTLPQKWHEVQVCTIPKQRLSSFPSSFVPSPTGDALEAVCAHLSQARDPVQAACKHRPPLFSTDMPASLPNKCVEGFQYLSTCTKLSILFLMHSFLNPCGL